MSSGPQHYRESEKLLTFGAEQAAEAVAELGDDNDPLIALLRAIAQLLAASTHATLANAAAQAANIRRNGAVVGGDSKSDELAAEWSNAIWPTS